MGRGAVKTSRPKGSYFSSKALEVTSISTQEGQAAQTRRPAEQHFCFRRWGCELNEFFPRFVFEEKKKGFVIFLLGGA